MEKEVVLWKRMAEEQKERGNALEFEVNEWHLRAQGERKNADEVSLMADSVACTTIAHEPAT